MISVHIAHEPIATGHYQHQRPPRIRNAISCQRILEAVSWNDPRMQGKHLWLQMQMSPNTNFDVIIDVNGMMLMT